MGNKNKFPYWIPVICGIIFYVVAFFIYEDTRSIQISHINTSLGVVFLILYGKIEDSMQEIKEFITRNKYGK